MLWRQQQSATPTASREGRSPFLSGVLRAVCHEFALRAVCHAWRAFKPILGRKLSKFVLVGSALFCAREAFFTLSAATKTCEYTDPLRRATYSRTTCTTKNHPVCRVPRVCAVCRVSRVACFQTFVFDREQLNCLVGSPVLCGLSLLHLEGHHKDIPKVQHVIRIIPGIM